MNMKYLRKDGLEVDREDTVPVSRHCENIHYLSNHEHELKQINTGVEVEIKRLFLDIHAEGTGYLNSGDVAKKVCCSQNLPDNEVYHGFVGSLLLEMLVALDPRVVGFDSRLVMVASKPEGATWFDYFPDRNTVKKISTEV